MIRIRECVEMRPLMSCVAATIAVLFLTSCGANKGSFILENGSKEPIVRALVVICDQTIELNDVQPNKSAAGSYEVTSDSHYTIQVELQSGKRLRKETGYVTHGMDFHHEITVTDSDIEITDSTAK